LSIAVLGQILLIQTNFGNFDEARYNLDKSIEPLSRQKVPFQDQALPTIASGPESILRTYIQIQIDFLKFLQKPIALSR